MRWFLSRLCVLVLAAVIAGSLLFLAIGCSDLGLKAANNLARAASPGPGDAPLGGPPGPPQPPLDSPPSEPPGILPDPPVGTVPPGEPPGSFGSPLPGGSQNPPVDPGAPGSLSPGNPPIDPGAPGSPSAGSPAPPPGGPQTPPVDPGSPTGNPATPPVDPTVPPGGTPTPPAPPTPPVVPDLAALLPSGAMIGGVYRLKGPIHNNSAAAYTGGRWYRFETGSGIALTSWVPVPALAGGGTYAVPYTTPFTALAAGTLFRLRLYPGDSVPGNDVSPTAAVPPDLAAKFPSGAMIGGVYRLKGQVHNNSAAAYTGGRWYRFETGSGAALTSWVPVPALAGGGTYAVPYTIPLAPPAPGTKFHLRLYPGDTVPANDVSGNFPVPVDLAALHPLGPKIGGAYKLTGQVHNNSATAYPGGRSYRFETSTGTVVTSWKPVPPLPAGGTYFVPYTTPLITLTAGTKIRLRLYPGDTVPGNDFSGTATLMP